MRRKIIDGIRGSITDRYGVPLVETIPFLRLILEKKKLSIEDEKFLGDIASVISINFQKSCQGIPAMYKNPIKDSLSFEELSYLLERGMIRSPLSLEVYYHRVYLYGNSCCHFLGYVQQNELKGKIGIEGRYDDELTGKTGYKKIIVDAKGNIVFDDVEESPVAGSTIITTIDYQVQNILESVFDENHIGCGMIFDPFSGDILAMVSLPRFDPSLFTDLIEKDRWDSLCKSGTFINRCLQATYPPGSIFKLISTIALLEEKKINEGTTWYCPGYTMFCGRKCHCHKRDGHGFIDIYLALAYSCNIPFFESAKGILSIDSLNRFASLFGFGKKTGISLFEQTGLVPSRVWKWEQYHQRWYTGETLNIAIGQGQVKVTPMQVARFMGAVATGYLVKPRIFLDEPIEKNEISVGKDTIKTIKKAIYLASLKGTSSIFAPLLKEWFLLPKTATIQLKKLVDQSNKPKDDGDQNEYIYRHHGMIVCYAEHKKIKPFVIVILLENAGSSAPTVRMAKKFFEKYQREIMK